LVVSQENILVIGTDLPVKIAEMDDSVVERSGRKNLRLNVHIFVIEIRERHILHFMVDFDLNLLMTVFSVDRDVLFALDHLIAGFIVIKMSLIYMQT